LSETPLSAFVHQAQGDEQLQQALAGAPDAAAVASIAQAAGYPISEVDLWLASGTTPDELTASLRPLADGGSVEALPRDAAFQRDEGLSAGDGPSEVDTPRTIHGSAEAIPFAAEGAPVGEASLIDEGVWGGNDLQAAPAVSADDISPRASAEDAIRQLLGQAQADEALRQALACAPDGAAVAAIAQAAGYPISELALWLASGAAFEEAQPEPEPSSLEDDPLTLFLRAVEVDADLQIALASAPDAATVAAIARVAGFPLTAADLWAASDAVPQELELQELIFVDLAADDLLLVVDRDGA
jgi:predicted ribosomally synthesized peptide with nif11-like leader